MSASGSSQAAGPALSIVIPTFNRARYLVSTVEQLFRQDFQDFELFVIDQSEVDQRAIVADGVRPFVDAARLTLVPLTSVGVANARNEGLGRVRGKIVMFLDDDVVLLSDGFLRAHMDCYADSKIGGVTGRTIERVNRENTRRTANRITRGGRTLINLLGHERCEIHSLKGANMSVRAEAIAGMGGFDRSYTGTALLEEADFAERIAKRGWRFVFEPRAELLHLSAPAGGVRVATKGDKEYFRFRSTAYFIRKHRGMKGLLPFAAVHALIAAIHAAKSRDAGLPLRMLRGAMDGVRRGGNRADQDIQAAAERSDPATGGVASTAVIMNSGLAE